jgi:hypothetical protein
VILPRIPEPSYTDPKSLLVKVDDKFKEEIIKIDASSVESLEFLNDASLLAVGCGSGVVKIVSVAQSSNKLKEDNVQFVLKGDDQSPVTGLACNQNNSLLRHAIMVTHS